MILFFSFPIILFSLLILFISLPIILFSFVILLFSFVILLFSITIILFSFTIILYSLAIILFSFAILLFSLTIILFSFSILLFSLSIILFSFLKWDKIRISYLFFYNKFKEQMWKWKQVLYIFFFQIHESKNILDYGKKITEKRRSFTNVMIWWCDNLIMW